MYHDLEVTLLRSR